MEKAGSALKPSFDSIPSCISSFSRGEFIIVLDSPDRENEADLIIAAQDLTPEKMAFMIRYSSGLICAPLSLDRASQLELPPMVPDGQNTDPNRTAYTVSVDAAAGVTTGISAQDRARTCNILASPDRTAGDLRRPGHIFPLTAKRGGVLQRRGHTEAAVDFCRLAGKEPVAAICEMVEDGEVESDADGIPTASMVGAGMMRTDTALAFGRIWGLKVCTIEGLVDHIEKQGMNGVETNGVSQANGDYKT